MVQLTVFYDGYCPLCVQEMLQLQAADSKGKIAFEDINLSDFSARFPDIQFRHANAKIHGKLADGKIITGLDVTVLAWSLVDKHQWLKVLRWPLIRYVADAGYLIFAKYRTQISYWLTGKARCERCEALSADSHDSKN